MSEIETDMHPAQFPVFLVGENVEDAKTWNPYETLEEALEEARGFAGEGMKVFKAMAHVDFDSAEEVS